jgi:hypothetical protein
MTTINHSSVKLLLIAARKIISARDNWTTVHLARDTTGKPIYFADRGACKFCAMGATHRAGHDYKQPVATIQAAIDILHHHAGGRVSMLNDICTHAEILQVFDSAIEATK